ncbi:MAG TPA: hypothetical protein VNE86_07505 [Nitrososphaerales archaeon]|nr:hypothetical protein [Nitrososphaerales archaeon]
MVQIKEATNRLLSAKSRSLQSLSDAPTIREHRIIESVASENEIVCAEINSLREECLQITELLKLEEIYLKEVIKQFREIMMPLNVSIPLTGATIPRNDLLISDAVLNSDGMVCILNEGKILYRISLGEFQTETVLKIIDKVLPQLKNLVTSSQEKPSERLSSIERIAKELSKIISGERTGDQFQGGRSDERPL